MEAETQEAEIQINGTTQPEQVAEATQETEAQTNGDTKPAGYDPIDETTATPQQVKERLDYLYRQVKDSERDKREYNKVLKEQSRLIGELTNGMGTVVNHLQDKSFADSEASLVQQRQAAFERGDAKSYDEINDKLMDIKLNKKLTATQRIAVQTQQNNVQPQYNNAAEIAQRGVQDGELDANDARLIASWQDERDETGGRLRPWAFSDSPQHMQAAAEAAAVWRNPRFVTTEQKIAEVDRRMGVAKRTVSQTVMGANLTNRGKSNKVTLSPKQQEIALRMGGSKKSDTEKLEWYRKQVERVKSTKGARQ